MQTDIVSVLVDKKLTTKHNLNELEVDIQELELRLKHDLTLRLGAMLAASMAMIVTICKVDKLDFFNKLLDTIQLKKDNLF